MSRYFILFLFLYLPAVSFAQENTNLQLAIQYYNTGEYAKSVVLFEEMFHNEPGSSFYYSYYLNCLLQLKDYKTAELEIKKQVKRFPQAPQFQVDLGYIFHMAGNDKKQKETYDQILSKLPSDENVILRTVNAFMERSENNYAIEVILKGRKLINDPFAFSHTLATLYYSSGRLEDMTNEYLFLVKKHPDQLSQVEDRLQDIVQIESNYETIKNIVLAEVQKTDYNPTYIRLLTWLYIQKKDFWAAWRQQKALDKRYNDNGTSLIQLAEICKTNKAWDVTDEIYQYIIEKGNASPYYFMAKYGLIDVKYLKITSTANPSQADLTDIETSYTNYLSNDFFRNIEQTEKVIIRLAEIKAVYLSKTDEAISLLLKYANAVQLSKTSRALMKLDLGDYYVLKGDFGEASLIYKQVDLDFRDNPIGHEARFRNAKLSFYKGEFEWAATQLDVLKASTSELIANDALQLSLLIQDNLVLDSNTIPLSEYSRADFFYFKKQYDSSIVMIDSLLIQYPSHSLADEAYFLKAKSCVALNRYDSALQYFEKVYTSWNTDILADDALYNAAKIYEDILKNDTKAMGLYEKLVLDYPDSVFVVEARKRFREIRGS